MKKIFLSMVMGFLLLTFSPFANAWHLEYRNGYSSGNFSVDQGLDYLLLEVSDWGDAEAGWEVASATRNFDGSISVDYDIRWGNGYPYWSDAHVEFQIVSDYGNMNTVLVGTTINGGAFAAVGVQIYGNASGLVGASLVEAGLSNTYGGSGLYIAAMADDLAGYADDADGFNEIFPLEANSWYSIDADFLVEVWAGVSGLPDTFGSWGEFADFFDDEYAGDIEASTFETGLSYELLLTETETPVPVPATILLFGLGILCLTGVRRKSV